MREIIKSYAPSISPQRGKLAINSHLTLLSPKKRGNTKYNHIMIFAMI
jgi:hypothetical protein